MEAVTRAPASACWVEIVPRHGAGAVRQRIGAGADAVTIGRAWDNDIVLDDPHVAAHHLRLQRDIDGRWSAEDLGSRNGLHVEGERQRRERIELDAGTTLRVGQTLLRLHRAADPVAPELPLAQGRSPWPFALGATLCVALLEVLGIWLSDIAEPKPIRYLVPPLATLVVIALWTTLWSVLSRVFAGHAWFGRHLLIAAACLLAYSLWNQGVALAAFALSWTALANSLSIAGWLVFGLACFLHLAVMGRRHLLPKAGAIAALVALAITLQTLRQSELHETAGTARTLARLQPPSMRLVKPQGIDAFLAEVQALKAPLDEARRKEPGDDEDEDEDDAGLSQ